MKCEIDRREILALSGASLLAGLRPQIAQASIPKHLVMVHGRAQGERDPDVIRDEWRAALEEGAQLADVSLPPDVRVSLPFYGERLDELVEASKVSTASNITAKGNETQDAYLRFQAELANEMRTDLAITDDQVDAQYGDNQREKGPLNWEWVQAIIKAIDAHSDGITAGALELFTRDVFLYLELDLVREEVDRMVSEAIDDQPTIVIGHSLGSVVSYQVLRNRPDFDVPTFVTLGSPLGIQAIRKRLAPIAFPASVGSWSNYYDERDVVALNPLNDTNFLVDPKIENVNSISNKTDNRHGISGYLNDQSVANEILSGF